MARIISASSFPLGRLAFRLSTAVVLGLLTWTPPLAASAAEEEAPRAVADTPSTARAADGRYISWREHIIDDTERAAVEISGSDGLVMADLDLDGHLDIVSVHESDTTYDGVADGRIRIAFGSDDPARWTLVTLAEGSEAGAAEDVATGDVNGDGYPDVVAACELAHLVYFQNPGKTGAGTRGERWPRVIPPITTGRGSFIRVFLGDFDGDGRLEAVAPNKGAQNPGPATREKRPVSIFWLDGDPLEGASWREHELGRFVIPQNSQPIDLDGDGDLDVVAGSRGEGRLVWFENTSPQNQIDRPSGSRFAFVEHPIELDSGRAGGFNLAFADVDGDGRLDIVTAVNRALGWLEQPPAPSHTWKAHVIGTFVPDAVTGFALADIDGDGDLDTMAGSYSRGPRDRDGEEVTPDDPLGRIGWFEQGADPAAEWTRHDVSRRKRGMFDQFVAQDLDGDGDLDFVSTRGNSAPYDGVFWLEQLRTDEPRAAFTRAREHDSEEMPLPGALPAEPAADR